MLKDGYTSRQVIDHLSVLKGIYQGLRVADIALDNLNVQPLESPPVGMDQNPYRTALGQQSRYQVSPNVAGGTGYYYHYLTAIISHITPESAVRNG